MAANNRKRYFSLIFVPDQERNPKSISMSYQTGKALIVLLGIVVVHVILGGIGYARLFSVSQERNRLTLENNDLVRQNKKIEKIADDFRRNKIILDRILNAYGVTLGVTEGGADLRENAPSNAAAVTPTQGTASQMQVMGMNIPVQNHLPYLVTDSGDFYNPENVPTLLPVEGFLTTRFQEGGWMLSKRHLGIDIAANSGTPIWASGSGTVIFADWTPDFGYLVILSHNNGYFTYYGHASSIKVEVGAAVARGDVIAYLGSSGMSSAPHLHFEIWRDGKAVDPEEVIYAIHKQSKSGS